MSRLGHRFELVSIPHPRSTGPRQLADWPQVNHDLHLVHTIRGRGALRIGRRLYPTDPRTVLAVPLHTLCLWDKPDDGAWEMINLHYQLTLPGGEALHERCDMPVVFHPRGLPAIHRKLLAWSQRWRAGEADLWTRLDVAAQVHALVASYWSAHAVPLTRPRPRDAAVQTLRQLIDQHPDQPFNAAALAAAVGLSVSQMNRRFRAATGRSPKAHWQQQRASLCRRALREYDHPLERLSPSLGFRDVSYFSRWFRQQMGMTPSEYRRRSRSLVI